MLNPEKLYEFLSHLSMVEQGEPELANDLQRAMKHFRLPLTSEFYGASMDARYFEVFALLSSGHAVSYQIADKAHISFGERHRRQSGDSTPSDASRGMDVRRAKTDRDSPPGYGRRPNRC